MRARCPGKHCRPASVVVDVRIVTEPHPTDTDLFVITRTLAPHKRPDDRVCVYSGAWLTTRDEVVS